MAHKVNQLLGPFRCIDRMVQQSPFAQACFDALDVLAQRHRTLHKSLPKFLFWLRYRHIPHSE
jgi:hypothetical protein